MNEKRNRESLLRDILEEDSDAGFRSALLDTTLRMARRRRQFRQIRKVGAVVALAAAIAGVAWQQFSIRRHVAAVAVLPQERLPAKSYALVQTHSISQVATVETKAISVFSVVSSSSALNVVNTDSSKSKLREIDDDELLRFAGPSAAVLVRRGSQAAELVFVDVENHQAELRN